MPIGFGCGGPKASRLDGRANGTRQLRPLLRLNFALVTCAFE